MKPTIFVGLLLIISFLVFYFVKEQGQIRINSQRAGIALLHGGYRAWGFEYSHGILMTQPPKNLWHWPTWYHVDVRPFLWRTIDATNLTNTTFQATSTNLQGPSKLAR